jgi:hypothetical protein
MVNIIITIKQNFIFQSAGHNLDYRLDAAENLLLVRHCAPFNIILQKIFEVRKLFGYNGPQLGAGVPHGRRIFLLTPSGVVHILGHTLIHCHANVGCAGITAAVMPHRLIKHPNFS